MYLGHKVQVPENMPAHASHGRSPSKPLELAAQQAGAHPGFSFLLI